MKNTYIISFLCHSFKQESQPDDQNLVVDFKIKKDSTEFFFKKSKSATKKRSLSRIKLSTSVYVISATCKKVPTKNSKVAFYGPIQFAFRWFLENRIPPR